MSNGEEIIEITINKDGTEISLDAKGFSGKKCSIALNELGNALGSITTLNTKSEFYNTEKTEEVIITIK